MLKNKSNLSIKALTIKALREQEEPFFYLAPDIVGSVNNAYPSKGRKLFVVDFNTIDNHNMKLSVPHQCYKNYFDQNKGQSADGGSIVKDFLMKFLADVKPYEPKEGEDEMLGEMVDEFGDLYGDKNYTPANIRGNPGHGNTKDSDSARQQITPRHSQFVGPMGYGAVTW